MKLGLFLVFVSLGLGLPALQLGGPFLLLLWPSASALIVSVGYLFTGPGVLGKRADGTLAPLRVALLFPFFAFMWTMFHLQRRLLGEDCCDEVAPGLFLGRRPLPGELPADIALVVDLTSEFAELKEIRSGRRYLALPALDGGVPELTAFEAAVEQVALEQGRVYVHCASGHGRSTMLCAAVLMRRGLAKDVAEAEALLQARRPSVRLHGVQRRALASLTAVARKREPPPGE